MFRQKEFVQNGGVGLANPGESIEITQRFGSRAAALYQSQISGLATAMADDEKKTWHVVEYQVNGVKFDGVNFKTMKLLDAKANYAWTFKVSFAPKMQRELVETAQRQLQAIQGTDFKGIEWHFNEKDAARQVEGLLRRAGVEGIDVRYTPPKEPIK